MNQLTTRTPLLIAAEINNIKEQTQRMLLINSIEIGRRLIEAKTLLQHGEWGNWLEESVDYSQRTANNLMKIFEQYGDSQLGLFGSEAKSQALANLNYTQAVALLGIPDDDREQFIKDNDIESMSTRELQQAIKEKQELEKKLKESEERAKRFENIANNEQKVRENLEGEIDVFTSQKNNLDTTIERLQAELEEAKTSGNDNEVLRLQDNLKLANDELAESKEKIKKLEQQLKEKPIEVPAISEKIPEDVEKELEELRKKVAEHGSGKAFAKFEVCFNALANGFKELLVTLDQIEDNVMAEKYKNAVKGLINKMSERVI